MLFKDNTLNAYGRELERTVDLLDRVVIQQGDIVKIIAAQNEAVCALRKTVETLENQLKEKEGSV